MLGYIARRLLLVIPTVLGIMLLNFIIVQAAPGGPIQQVISQMRGDASDVDSRLGGGGDQMREQTFGMDHSYRGAQGVDPEFIKQLEKQFGFDKPAHERFWLMLKNYASFDFGKSYFRDRSVIEVVKSKLPVSIPLGIRKAVSDGSRFDIATSAVVVVAYAVPGFLFALFLIVLFAGGSFIQIFPLRGLFSDGWETLSFFDKITDYFWHLFLPLLAMVISGFAKLTLLTKNSFLEEINKQYVTTARAKGLEENKILYGHIFRNAMLIVIAGFPAAFVHILFTSSLLIEVLFSLDGLGLLGFEAAMSRDYPVMFGCLYMFTLLGMFLHLFGDIMYMVVDRRIDLSASRGLQS
jgi:microcin C transport system permease protein